MNTELDFPNTCPLIDKGIIHLKASMYDKIDGIIQEVCPLWEDNYANGRPKKIDDWANSIYEDVVGPLIEEIRELNSQMRAQADKQIWQINKELDDMREELSVLTGRD
jgi:hypothetical protein